MVAPVSLVITTYNRQQYLGAAIASILAQTYRDFELLIWDDGSCDRTLEIAQAYACKDSRIRVVAAEHQGRVPSLKAAIAQTQGCYLGWVDDDDLLAPTALAQTVATLDSHSHVGWVYTDYVDIDAHNQILGYGKQCRIPYSPTRMLVDFMTFHFRLIRRLAFEQVGGLEGAPEHCEDYDLSLKLSEVASVYHLQRPLYFYRRHTTNDSVIYSALQRQRAQRTVERAIQRRGLNDQVELKVIGDRFILCRKPQVIPALPVTVRHTATRSTGIFLATLPLLGLAADQAVALVSPAPGQLSSYNQPKGKAPEAQSSASVSAPDQTLLSPQFTQSPLLAQAITPANDGTNTAVTQQGNQFDITGGQLSGDQTNLFHSFEQFGLSSDQIANFISRPEIQNILGRVVGGDPSVINGLLQVTGGNSNLYLVNPAGILVGPSAQLNVPAALTLSTANSIGFGDQWFNVTGSNAYSFLNGNPSQFAFTTSQPGAVVNTGDLTVGSGQALSLIGGTVINTGQIIAPGGQILLSSVPGENIVRLSQPGHLLSLEIVPGSLPTSGNLPITTLPELLTGQDTPGLAVNQAGQAILTATNTVIPQGSGITLASGSLDVSSLSGTGGAIAVLGDRVGLFNASLNASGQTGGGQVFIGGDYQGQGTLPTASRTYVNSGSSITADALATGNGGQVILWGDDVTQFYGNISAKGGAESGNGGFVEVSSPGWLDYQGEVNTSAPNGTVGTLLLDPTNIEVVGNGYNTDNLKDVDAFSDPDLDPVNQVTRLLASAINNAFADVVLQATNNITFDADVIVGFGYSLTAEAGNNIEVNNPISLQGQNALQFTAGNSILLDADLEGGEGSGNVIDLKAGNTIEINGTLDFASGSNTQVIASAGNAITVNADILLNDGSFTSNSSSFDAANTLIKTGGGDIDITATAGDIAVGTLDTERSVFEGSATGGSATLSAFGNITTGDITTRIDSGTGGLIALTSNTGTVTTGDLDASGTSQGGDIRIVAQSSISTGTLNTSASGLRTRSGIGNGGNVFLDPQGDIEVSFINAQGSSRGVGGNVDITTQRFFRATQTFIDQNGIPASISTAGGQGGGQVIIRHSGGSLETPFTVGPDYNSTNGTVGAITTGEDNTVSDGSYPVTYNQGAAPSDIQLITQAPPPPPPPPPPEPDLPDPTVTEHKPPTSLEPGSSLAPTTKAEIKTLDEAREILKQIEDATGIKPALVYVQFVPRSVQVGAQTQEIAASPEDGFTNRETNLTQTFEAYLPLPGTPTQTPVTNSNENDQLELMVLTAEDKPIWKRVDVPRSQVLETAQKFRLEVADPRKIRTTSYLSPAQDLYQWVIAPIQAELKARGIQNLTFLPDPGLRSIPWAALHDGSKFLIEDYSVGLMPSLSLTDTRYTNVRNLQLLAMGASKFDDQRPLPAVPFELANLKSLWQATVVEEDQFTFENVRQLRQRTPFGVVHMATHGEFKTGTPQDSYIQLKDTRLHLDQLRQLGWSNPPLELLVLSACRTALGDENAELGFAGLAVQAGVKSAMASLWYVSDVGTLALMTEFYHQLREDPAATTSDEAMGESPHGTMKAEALRQAQLELLHNKVYLEKGQLLRGSSGESTPISPEFSGSASNTLQHPYYWAAFTLIGNPW
ncbi:MAG TPA: CHAT domain-containing protein [Leptolyngbyaceae cyanobacterium]